MQKKIMIGISCICILLTAGIFFAAFLLREPMRQETAQSDTQIQLADITAQCQIWESRYGKENEFPVDIFKDLQRYVAEENVQRRFPPTGRRRFSVLWRN